MLQTDRHPGPQDGCGPSTGAKIRVVTTSDFTPRAHLHYDDLYELHRCVGEKSKFQDGCDPTEQRQHVGSHQS